ncbi:dockerin type I domain-containing protein [Roseimaritima ulvae]|uniref:dockerin type I domain-containing protein n=1 Tax=Roseimaritima ulvae TaxID=980254 RepID=UPI0008374D8B|nr:dockerin type I domain-containing protein [Roseimaritima ulvae]
MTLERLCDRRVLAAITGIVFEDANETLRLDDGETGLEDRIVYLDLNQDGRPGMGEPLQRTTAEGGFQFDNLEVGDYVVRLYNGTASQRQTFPVAPQLEDNLLQISDVQLQTTSSDGALVYGLVDNSVARIDHQTGDIQTLSLGGPGHAIHPLPDGDLLVLADAAKNPINAAWVVSFDESLVTPLDLGLQPGESGWASATLNAQGRGVLTAYNDAGQPSALRSLVFENGQLHATTTPFEVVAGTSTLSSGEGTLTLFAIPQEDGLQLIQWSNATGEVIPDTLTTITDGVQLEAFDEDSGLTVVRTNDDELLVLDAANGYATLDRIEGVQGPIVLDGLRDILYGQDEDTNLVIYDIQAMEITAVVNMPLPRAGEMTLIDEGRAILLGGDYAVLRVQLDRATGHLVQLASEEASADLLFGLFVQEENTAPVFQSSPVFQTAEDTPLLRGEPTLLTHGVDQDVNDRFIVLKASDPGAGTVRVGAGGNFVYNPAQDVFGQDQFEILLHDGRSVSAPTPVRINIAPVNDPIGPILVDLPPVIPEDIQPGVPLGVIDIVNVDAGEQIDIQVLDQRFLIENGQLVLADGVQLDFEGGVLEELTITATHTILSEDPEEAYYETISTTVPLQIGDVNEPVLGVNVNRPLHVTENSPGFGWLAELYAIDQDYVGDYTYEVDDERFEIADDQIRLKPDVALDHETDDGMEITITVHDGPFQASDKFPVHVADLNEVITGIAFPANTIRERIEGAVVGQMRVDDPDQPTTARLTVDDSRFEFVGTTLKLRDGVSVRADVPLISLVLTVTDESYPRFTEDLPVELTVLENPLPFHNESYPLDVDGSGGVDPNDVLQIINYLNQHGPGPIERPNVSGAPVYYDVNGDGMVTPLDALLVINQLNLENRKQVDSTVGGDEPPQSESPQGEAPQGKAGLDSFAAGPSPASSEAIDQAVLSYYVFDDPDEDEESLFDDGPEQLG